MEKKEGHPRETQEKDTSKGLKQKITQQKPKKPSGKPQKNNI